MSRLLIVRHGQASFLEPDYDKLSAKGETQSRLLGEYWTAHQLHFDSIFTGPRKRQRDTARIVGEVYQRSGLSWAQPEVLEEFDEFKAESVMEHAIAVL